LELRWAGRISHKEQRQAGLRKGEEGKVGIIDLRGEEVKLGSGWGEGEGEGKAERCARSGRTAECSSPCHDNTRRRWERHAGKARQVGEARDQGSAAGRRGEAG
jgi:hypothetical protein